MTIQEHQKNHWGGYRMSGKDKFNHWRAINRTLNNFMDKKETILKIKIPLGALIKANPNFVRNMI